MDAVDEFVTAVQPVLGDEGRSEMEERIAEPITEQQEEPIKQEQEPEPRTAKKDEAEEEDNRPHGEDGLR